MKKRIRFVSVLFPFVRSFRPGSFQPDFWGESFRPSWGGSFRPFFIGGSFRPDFWGESFRPDLFIMGKQVRYKVDGKKLCI